VGTRCIVNLHGTPGDELSAPTVIDVDAEYLGNTFEEGINAIERALQEGE